MTLTELQQICSTPLTPPRCSCALTRRACPCSPIFGPDSTAAQPSTSLAVQNRWPGRNERS
ncbi:hypothetical protein BJY59DRAFT_699637 [Rhodotorula toruloides]